MPYPIIYSYEDMYDAVFSALKEELRRCGIESFPADFQMIADWEYAEVSTLKDGNTHIHDLEKLIFSHFP